MARTVFVNGQIYEETGQRTVIVNGQIFEETTAAGGAATVSPMGHQRLDNQYMAIAASRLNGVLQ